MKFIDYYASLGLERNASEADIKKAYRKLAHKYHPDVSKEAQAESKFKEIAEAYQTLKDPEKRAAYDQLGTHTAGEEFKPTPDWGRQYAGSSADTASAFDSVDLADLFAGLAAGRTHGAQQRAKMSSAGEDYEIRADISVEQAHHGAVIDLNLSMPEFTPQGQMTRVPRAFKARVPRGATDGQRLRLRGQGGRGFNGGRDGDLYMTVVLRPHRLYRVSGHHLYLDMPLAPWEAALGTSVEVPTLGGPVQLKIPAGTMAGQSLRLSGRGLSRPHSGAGDLFAVIQIVLPGSLTERERELFSELAAVSKFSPRAALLREVSDES